MNQPYMPMEYRNCQHDHCEGILKFWKKQVISKNDIYACQKCYEEYEWNGGGGAMMIKDIA